MEHSYSKDFQPKDNVEVMATRTILIPRPPQCPSCHQHNNDDVLAKFDNQQVDPYFDQLPPSINDNIAKMAMEETDRLTKNVKNMNADDEDWDLKVNKFGWTKQQLSLYRQVSNILDYDQMARLAVSGRQNEGIIRRCSVDKSVSRMRAALAAVHWDIRLTQWLHGLLSEHLPPSYMASYLDILQTLRSKVPTLVDKMLAAKPAAFNADYTQAVTKRPWGANVPTKSRKLPGQSPVIVVIPSSVYSTNQQTSSRMKRWFSLLNTMTNVLSIQNAPRQPSLEHVTEQLVAATRTKIQELRSEMPNRHIILVGINAGAAIALQVALVETVSSVVCMGFAYNTLKGVRGAPDDRILDITTPILFVLGDNSARSSQEEIESLREKMSAQTSLVVVGSADDALRINKFNRHLEGVTQSMVDNMIADEIQDFMSTCILNPPGPRETQKYMHKRTIGVPSSSKTGIAKKRKHKDSLSSQDGSTPRKVGRPRLNKSNEMPTGKFRPERPKPTSALLKQNNESLKMAIQSILPPNDTPPANLMSTDDEPGAELIHTAQTFETHTISPQAVDNSGGISWRASEDHGVVTGVPLHTTGTARVLNQYSSGTAQFSTNNEPIVIRDSNPTPADKSSGEFVQLKPPTTTGRVQSAGVKNFFIRKGVDKRAPTQSFYTVRAQPATGEASTSQQSITPNDKKIIIKSQQIIKAANMPANTSTLDTSTTSTPTTNLSDILDLPILFADNDGNLQDQSAIASSPSAGADVQIETPEATSTPTANILITSPDGKLPNRPMVISAANVSKLAKPSSASAVTLKLIFSGDRLNSLNNRDERLENLNKADLKTMPPLKLTTAQYRELQDRHNLKSMPPLKLTSTAQSTAGTNLTGPGTFTKLAPGTKIDLSTLKIVKSGTSSSTSGNIAFKTAGIQHRDATKGTIVFKPATSLQSHQVIKSGILNRNITVRKVVSLIPSPKSSNLTPVATSVVETAVTSPPTSTPAPASTSTTTPTSPTTSNVDPDPTK